MGEQIGAVVGFTRGFTSCISRAVELCSTVKDPVTGCLAFWRNPLGVCHVRFDHYMTTVRWCCRSCFGRRHQVPGVNESLWFGCRGPGSSRGLAGGRGTGKSLDGKPGSGMPTKSKPSPFGVKVSEARTSKMAISEFSSGLAPRKKKKTD